MAFQVDFTTLRIFVAVAETLNITRAAEREHIATSAVSKRLTDLEYMLGAKLLYRLPRGVELTPAGEALRHHARNIMSTVDRLAADLGDYATGIKGHVRMMANRSSVVETLPNDLRTFFEQHPDINVDLQEENTAPILKAVEEGRTDIGLFTPTVAQATDLTTFDYHTDAWVLVVADDHPLAKRTAVRFEEALSEYFIGLEVQSAWDAVISAASAQAGRPLRMRFRLRSMDAICRMVAEGLGVTVAPDGIFAAVNPSLRLRAVRLDEAWAKRQLKIAVRDVGALPPPARLMLEHLRRAGAERLA